MKRENVHHTKNQQILEASLFFTSIFSSLKDAMCLGSPEVLNLVFLPEYYVEC